MGKGKGAHPAGVLFILSAACAMTFSEVSAQVATFTTQQYPLLGNTHIAADLNGDGTFRAKTDFPIGTQTQAVGRG